MSQSTIDAVAPRPQTAPTIQAAARVLLLAPSFGCWRGRYQLPRESTNIELKGRTVDNKKVTTPQCKLITDEYPRRQDPVTGETAAWKKVFDRLESRLGAAVDRYSEPFPITGVRIVPASVGPRFLQEIEELKADMEQAVGWFVREWDAIREEIRANTDAIIWQHVAKRLPRDRHELRAKFYIDVLPIRLAGLSGDSPNAVAVSAADLAAENAVVRDSVQRAVEEAIESLIAGPRQQLAEKLADLRDLIGRDGRVTERSFKPVRTAIQKLREFMFVDNGTLVAELNQLERQLATTPANSLDSQTAAATGFAAALERAYNQVTDSAVQASDIAAARRNFRTITFG